MTPILALIVLVSLFIESVVFSVFCGVNFFYSSDDRSSNKNSRWSQRRRSPSPKDRLNKSRMPRFSEKLPSYEHKISINTSYSNLISQSNFDVQHQLSVDTQNIIGQSQQGIVYSTPIHTSAPVIVAPPILLNVPPPQVMQTHISPSMVATPTPSLPVNNVLINTSNMIAAIQPTSVLSPENVQPATASSLTAQNTVTLPPPCIASVELSSIPPPNPIQVHNIPQPDPINTLTIPPPAPIQVQNIPPPSPIQLNEIPNPKPLDLMNIPTPSENICADKSISDHDFIKSIPPPNKSVPPPSICENTVNVNVGVPPPAANISAVTSTLSMCLPLPNILSSTSLPPPQQNVQQNITLQSIPQSQNILVHSVPPPQPQQQSVGQLTTLQTLHQPQLQTTQTLTTIQNLPPLPPQSQNMSITVPLQSQLQVGVIQGSVAMSNNIPSLMAQPVLPPPGMGLAPAHININCPPPALQTQTLSYVNQPPPMTSQMPPMNVPPPSPTVVTISSAPAVEGTYKDLNAGNYFAADIMFIF